MSLLEDQCALTGGTDFIIHSERRVQVYLVHHYFPTAHFWHIAITQQLQNIQ